MNYQQSWCTQYYKILFVSSIQYHIQCRVTFTGCLISVRRRTPRGPFSSIMTRRSDSIRKLVCFRRARYPVRVLQSVRVKGPRRESLRAVHAVMYPFTSRHGHVFSRRSGILLWTGLTHSPLFLSSRTFLLHLATMRDSRNTSIRSQTLSPHRRTSPFPAVSPCIRESRCIRILSPRPWKVPSVFLRPSFLFLFPSRTWSRCSALLPF